MHRDDLQVDESIVLNVLESECKNQASLRDLKTLVTVRQKLVKLLPGHVPGYRSSLFSALCMKRPTYIIP